MPRNVDPAINQLDSVFVYDVDDLSAIAQENLASRQREAELAEQMVSAEAARYLEGLNTQSAVGPVIKALRRRAMDIKIEELGRASKKLGDLDPGQQKSVERLVDGVINKLLHGVQISLKRSQGQEEGALTVALVQEMFKLEALTEEGDIPINGSAAEGAANEDRRRP